MANEHDAFTEQRKNITYWLRSHTDDLALLTKLEVILPSFVRRRYRLVSLWNTSVEIRPVTDDEAEADKLHADVNKLYVYLLGKAKGSENLEHGKPKRSLTSAGKIKYEFTMTGLPEFEEGLTIAINGLPAGSACRITKKVKGTRVIEDVEYEMVCDDEPTTEAEVL